MKAPSVLFTMFLSLLLVLPFVIKVFYTEPYPAIILPSGHITTLINQSTIDYDINYCNIVINGQTYPVDINTLLGTIPVQYHGVILNRNLGFLINTENQNKGLSTTIYLQKNETNNQLKKWYRDNVGVDFDALTIGSKTVNKSINSDSIISVNKKNERIYLFK